MTEQHCLAYPAPHPKQIPIKKFGKHDYSNLVYDPFLNKLIYKGRVVEWRLTKTNLKRKDSTNNTSKQYTYEALVIPDAEGKKRKIFKKKFESFINDMNIQRKQRQENLFDMNLLDKFEIPKEKDDPKPVEASEACGGSATDPKPKIELKPSNEEPHEEKQLVIQTQPNTSLSTQYKISILKAMIESEKEAHPRIYKYFINRPDVIWNVESDESSDEASEDEERIYYY
jgi:hypothetical protein